MRLLRVIARLSRQEPAVGFFLVAVVVLVATEHWFAADEGGLPPDEELRARLEVELTARNGRPPTETELRAAWPDFLEREMLYQEARVLGLERDDEIVRRRLIQKMEFLLEAGALQEPEDEALLQGFYERNTARYTEPPRVSFSHVFLGEEEAVAALPATVAAVLAALERGEPVERWSRPFLHGLVWRKRALSEVEHAFGPGFAEELAKLALGAWQGPVSSAFGRHLVRVEERIPERVLPFAEVRERVREDWREEQRRKARERGLSALREKYGLDRRLLGYPPAPR